MEKGFDKNINYVVDFNVKYVRKLSDDGSFSTLHLFKDMNIDRFLVAKFLTLPKALEEHYDFFSEKFKQEAEFLLNLSHENIVKAFSYGLDTDTEAYKIYYTMEYVEGDTLGKYVKEHPERINDFFLKLCEVFAWIHDKGIVHGDIKENNILVNNKGILKVIDFGLSKEITDDSSLFTILDKVPGLNRIYSNEEWDKIYNYKTDVFHLGKMFEKISKDINSFKYRDIVKKMVIPSDKERISLNDINGLIVKRDMETQVISSKVQSAIDNILGMYPIVQFNEKIPVKNDMTFESFVQNCNEFITSSINARDFYSIFFQHHNYSYRKSNSISKKDLDKLLLFMKESEGFYEKFLRNIHRLIDNTNVVTNNKDLPF